MALGDDLREDRQRDLRGRARTDGEPGRTVELRADPALVAAVLYRVLARGRDFSTR